MSTWNLGLLAGLATAVLWTLTAIFFEQASKKISSLVVNISRLALAGVFFLILSLVRFGTLIDPGLQEGAILWLALSGFIGFVLGDLFLFEAFVQVGARLSMLVYSLAPAFAALTGWVWLNEQLTPTSILGMFITLCGIVLAVFLRPQVQQNEVLKPMLHGKLKGLIFALIATVGQAVGLVISKFGAQGVDSFSATQIRVLAGLAGFALVFTILRRWKTIGTSLKEMQASNAQNQNTRKAWLYTVMGAVIGPFIGVSLGLAATKMTTTGIASTLMATVPLFMLLPGVVLGKEPLTWQEIIGTILAVAGVALLFINP